MDDRANSVEAIFSEAIQQTGPAQRAEYLSSVCSGDAGLRDRVEALIKAHEGAGSFMAPSPSADALRDSSEPEVAVTIDGKPDIVDLAAGPATPPRRLSQGDSVEEKQGSMIGRYKILQQIGEGGFGMVYMAEQKTPVKRRVALKVIKAGMDTRAVIARFEAERQALAMMDHPNIARVLDAGATDTGRPYFVMELVKGIPITQYCDRANLGMRKRLELFMDVCRAVQHAHQKGIIHRDLKPSNIMVTLRDDEPNVKVIDFGIAKATEQKLTEKTLFTEYGQMIGTPVYMSPEQAVMSEFDVDTRSDIYSLGVLLYELLTGSPPFDAQTLRSAGFDGMRRIIREQQPQKPSTKLSTLAEHAMLTVATNRQVSPHVLSRQLHGDLDWIVLKAIEKDRSRRYESASAFAQDIERHLKSEPVTAGAPGAVYKLRKFGRRNKGPMTAAALIGLLLLAGTVVSTWQAMRATRAEKNAFDTLAQVVAERDAKELARQAAKIAEKLADDRLVQVAAERDAKEQARAEAEAISTFMTGVFTSPIPGLGGRKITVAETLDRAAKQLETDLADQPARRATLQRTLGETYNSLGLYHEAIPLMEKSMDYCRTAFGAENPETLHAVMILAECYGKDGQDDRAIKLSEEALPLMQKVLVPEDVTLLYAKQNLARSYSTVGRRDEALALSEEAVTMARKVRGRESAESFWANLALASICDEVGRQDDALKLREEALMQSRKAHGLEYPTTLWADYNLAKSYDKAGRRDEAIELLAHALPLMRKVLDPEHPWTLLAMDQLAHYYHAAGQHQKALPLREEILPLLRKIRGPENDWTLWAMHNLADSYYETGHRPEALKLREEVLALRRKVSEPHDHATIMAITKLAVSYDDVGRKDEAAKLRAEVDTASDKK